MAQTWDRFEVGRPSHKLLGFGRRSRVVGISNMISLHREVGWGLIYEIKGSKSYLCGFVAEPKQNMLNLEHLQQCSVCDSTEQNLL
jgi:hypothetical protein